MSATQHILLGAGGADSGSSAKTYVDDVFSTYLYDGVGADLAIQNGVNLSDNGGLVWIKNRTKDNTDHALVDTERGAGYYIKSNSDQDQVAIASDKNFNSFTTTGFTLKNDSGSDFFNNESYRYASYSFRKTPGFFDVVTWVGNSVNPRQIAHSLGCVPGVIMIKPVEGASSGGNRDWTVYHRNLTGLGTVSSGDTFRTIDLNEGNSAGSNDYLPAAPTSTHFTVSDDAHVNFGTSTSNQRTYIGYLFAGGESTAATARSVAFDSATSGNEPYLTIPTDSSLGMGTGDFTIEAWVNPLGATTSKVIYDDRDGSNNGTCIYVNYREVRVYSGSTEYIAWSGNQLALGSWSHVAYTRQGSTNRLFVNGNLAQKWTNSSNKSAPGSNAYIGKFYNGSNFWDGKISNFRIVKGTAVYTSSFRPPTQPLTNITNTVLLCCNGSSTTSATVSPTTITANGGTTITASTDSPFDDTNGFVFGANNNQNIIKCGSYRGNNSTNGPEIYLGWEPSYLIIKMDGGSGWGIYDMTAGIVNGGEEKYVIANHDNDEYDFDQLSVTATGFKLTSTSTMTNGTNNYIYIAIRRPDGYVGKQYSAGQGTSVFDMKSSGGNTVAPWISSLSFAPDSILLKKPEATSDWSAYSRLKGEKKVLPNTSDLESTNTYSKWDYMNGWNSFTTSTAGLYQAWAWKRHAGFDVLAYTGNGEAGSAIAHSLSQVPEMMWFKRLTGSGTATWSVFHKGLDGGTNPELKSLQLGSDGAEGNTNSWDDTAPTSTHITLGSITRTNVDGSDYQAWLFASVPGISKVGSYTGSNSSQTQTISTGFSPRFVIIKCYDHSPTDWFVLDTIRGWNVNDDEILKINSTGGQSSSNYGQPTSSGFSVTNMINVGTYNYVYYAHA